ncbi:MAG: complex I subunit 1 family protein, partial [Planctomycetota bacterium]
LGQSAADGLKFILKEDFVPKGADKWLFTLAPMAAVVPAFIAWAVIPWGGSIEISEPIVLFGNEIVSTGKALVAVADLNIGLVYLLAVAGVGVYGVILGGWASNSKYSFLGGMRASASMISYEIPMGTAILSILLIAGSLQPSVIVEEQAANGWFIFYQPVAAILFFVCILAEANRAPFDNAEAEQELVGGFHTEYSAMRFAMFFLGEYTHMVVSSAFFVVLFLGGYHLAIPFLPAEVPGLHLLSPEATGLLAAIAKTKVFMVKVILIVCFMMLIRWTLPRIRFDQVMKLAWNTLIPIGILQVVATSLMVFFDLAEMSITGMGVMFLMNLALFVLIMALLGPGTMSSTRNRRIPLAGSRFNPLPGERVVTGPVDPVASADLMDHKTASASTVH